MEYEPIPDRAEERVKLLESVLLLACEGSRGPTDSWTYTELRREMMRDPVLGKLLPDFVRTCRDLGHFWPFIKGIHGSWAPRRQFVRDAMTPLCIPPAWAACTLMIWS